MHRELDETAVKALLSPETVMVVGASPEVAKFSGVPISNLGHFGYDGRVIPVNPRHESVAGLTCFPTIEAAPPAEAAIVVVPAPSVPGVLRQCAQKGIRVATVVSSGFGERLNDPAARELNTELQAAIDQTGIRVIGPNTTGIASFANHYVPRASGNLHPRISIGPVAVVTQSGATNNVIINELHRYNVGVSHGVSTGNQIDITIENVLPILESDPETTTVLIYAEDSTNHDELVRKVGRLVAAGKQVAVLRAGRTPSGQAAAKRHTGAQASFDDQQKAQLKTAGAIVVEGLTELSKVGTLWGHGLHRFGKNLGVIAMSGGEGSVLADRASSAGFRLPDPAESTIAELSSMFSLATPGNPFDSTGEVIHHPELLATCLRLFIEDSEFDGVLLALPVLGETDAGKIEQGLVETLRAAKKPVVVTTWPSDEASRSWTHRLRERGVACLDANTEWLNALLAVSVDS